MCPVAQDKPTAETPELPPDISNLTGDRFFEFCALNRKLRSERTAERKIIFRLPIGASRSPDASWIPKSRWEVIPAPEREKFPRICPDSVVKLLPASKNPAETKLKMEEYIVDGARLGWLIDPKNKRVWTYVGAGVQILERPAAVSADPILPGFTLDLTDILW